MNKDTLTLTSALLEIADEMDKGENADVRWLLAQAQIVRLAATRINP